MNIPDTVVKEVSSTSANTVLPILHDVISTFGFLSVIKSDNEPSFNGQEFEKLCKHFSMHELMTPYWPRANGEVERFIQNIA